LKGTDVHIAVEGHTDNVPIAGDKFPSNWDLSVSRAVNIVKYMINNGGIEPKRLSAVGYAHSRPIASNETAEGRKLNRRVNILLTIGGE
ncbi:MAG: OmpA family protein, partial [Smithellaceae bacterium]|nr:OmpA family protein [Smithellaceae bacterium]